MITMKGKKLSAQSHNIISTTLGFSPFLPHTYNKAISTLNLISTAVRHISCHRSTLKAGWFDSTDSATALVRPALKNAVYNDIDQYQNLKSHSSLQYYHSNDSNHYPILHIKSSVLISIL